MSLRDTSSLEARPSCQFHNSQNRIFSIKYLTPLLGLAALTSQLIHAAPAEPLFTQAGSDPSFADISGKLSRGSNSNQGVTGSKIHVNKRVVEAGPDAANPIPHDIKIHTLANSAITRKDFQKWSRWYQENGHTQVFRLFKGETNVRNDRPLAARVEAHSNLQWQQGAWHEWSGTYTIIQPEAACIFQVMNSGKAEWSVHLNMDDKGNVICEPRRDPKHKKVIAANMTGKPFSIRVRDNGLEFEVYLNNAKVSSGSYVRPDGHSSFRWGMYKGEHEMKGDAMLFVTGASFK